MSLIPAWACMLGLVLALLLPQMLTLLHGVTHLSSQGGQRSPTARVDHPINDSSPLTVLFSLHTDGSPDCRLYDQASRDGVARAVATLDAPPPAPGTAVALFAGGALARWAALFDARGPPPTA
jgi:hypothetical protein